MGDLKGAKGVGRQPEGGFGPTQTNPFKKGGVTVKSFPTLARSRSVVRRVFPAQQRRRRKPVRNGWQEPAASAWRTMSLPPAAHSDLGHHHGNR